MVNREQFLTGSLKLHVFGKRAMILQWVTGRDVFLEELVDIDD